jgi:hypothetical protein
MSIHRLEMGTLLRNILRALSRARLGILSIAAAYFLSLLTGIVMVHSGNQFALSRRDHIITSAQNSSFTLKSLNEGHALRAALLDFAGNCFLGGLPTTIAGYWAPAPFPIALYRGWIGGIVSVDDRHRSRFRNSSQAIYYIVVILLQLTPYSLVGGAGVNMGIARVHPSAWYAGKSWLGVPLEAIRDAARIFGFAMPLFLIASLFEFLAS